MISVMVSLLAGVASQPAVARPLPDDRMTPMLRESPPSRLPGGPVPASGNQSSTRRVENNISDGRAGLLNMSEVFSSEDYPIEALKKREQGKTSASVSIDTDGRATACRITQSSGSPSLDATTCRLLIEKGKFIITRGAEGLPVARDVSTNIRWILPEGHRSVSWVDYVVKTIFSIAPGGKPGECRVEISSPIDKAKDRCLGLQSTLDAYLKKVEPGFDSSGKELVLESGSLVGEGADSLPVGKAVGSTLLHRRVLAVERDQHDQMTKCRAGRYDPISDKELRQACAEFADSKADASVSKEAKKVRPMNWVFYEAVYWRSTPAAILPTPLP